MKLAAASATGLNPMTFSRIHTWAKGLILFFTWGMLGLGKLDSIGNKMKSEVPWGGDTSSFLHSQKVNVHWHLATAAGIPSLNKACREIQRNKHLPKMLPKEHSFVVSNPRIHKTHICMDILIKQIQETPSWASFELSCLSTDSVSLRDLGQPS